ncbi:lipase family protein [Streptomyces cylindrosporus]|uniref:Lipase family protein n=1 Tax=Streptomyces cylindrosporus TaxID=2927583 RepID=A0ABS9Y169_9ACTN|nr:lipase family protein [Streptomyces cylindrosporus]MCI3270963.1 lipase family protein [Streptomyces cylindrosporus]
MRDTYVKGPSYTALRPCKPDTDPSSFPVHPDLVDRLVEDKHQPDPDGIVPHTMATCAAYSYAGFEQHSDVETVSMIMARLGLEENRCRAFEQRVDALYIASAAYLVQDRDRRVVILCYRGTQPEDIISILTDADVRPETLTVELEGHHHEVHAGFYRNVRATRHLIVQALERALRGESVDPDEEGTRGTGLEALYITGHSLGAAMAAIMAVTLVHEPRYRHIAEKLKGVYTFGQPMVGGPDLARACEETPGPHGTYVLRDRLIRYIFDRDVVPALPPRPVGPYAPFGREFHYRRRHGLTDAALTFAADSAIEGLTLPSDVLRTAVSRDWGGLLARVTGGVRRSVRPLARAREEGWTEVTEPGLHYPQMDSLAGLAVVAPLAFFATRLALTRTIPFKYSFDDHGPGHYVNALAPPGVLSEFGDVL